MGSSVFFLSGFVVLGLLGCASVPGPTSSNDGPVQLTTRWVMPLRSDHNYSLRPIERSQPLVVGDIVFVAGNNQELIAAHRTAGYTLWQQKLKGAVQGSLGYGGSMVLVGDREGNLTAFNTHDGSEAWQAKIQAEWATPAVVARDKVLVASVADDLYCYNKRDGRELWHFSHRGEDKMRILGASTPAVFGNEVYLGFSDGSVASIELATGKANWVRALRVRTRFSDIDMKPYVDESSVIVGGYDGRLHSLNRLTGDTQWMFPAGTYGGVLVDGGRVYFPGLNGTFYALDKATGVVAWSRPLEMQVGLLPAKVDRYLVFSSSDDPIVVLDSQTGDLVDSFSLGAGTMAPIAVADGWIYAMSNFGKLYSFQLSPRRTQKGPETIVLPSALNRVAAHVAP